MFTILKKWSAVLVLAVPLLFASTPDAVAQRHRGNGWNGRHGYRFNGNRYYGNRYRNSYYRNGYGNRYYGNRYYNGYYGNGYYSNYPYYGNAYGTPRFNYRSYGNGGVLQLGPVQIPIN